jgi:hydrogenase maturation factor
LIGEGYEILKFIQELPMGDFLTGEDFIKVKSWVTRSDKLIKGLCPRYTEFSVILQELLSNDKFSHITNDSFSDVNAILTCLLGVYSDYKNED